MSEARAWILAAAWAAALTACAESELGEVALTHAAVTAGADASAAREQRVQSFLFGSRSAGLLLYSELRLDDGSLAQIELDVSASDPHEVAVRYVELRGERVSFFGHSASGVVELPRDADGALCACDEGRLALRIRDHGPDGVSGTADDALRELRDGVYRFGGSSCTRPPEPAAVTLDGAPDLQVRYVDTCRADPVIAREPEVADRFGQGPSPRYTADSADRERSQVGCGSEPYEPEPEPRPSSGGCESGGATRSQEPSSQADGCGSGGSQDASGCDGDDASANDASEDERQGCEPDTARAARTTSRRVALSGPAQNYAWLGLAIVCVAARSRRGDRHQL